MRWWLGFAVAGAGGLVLLLVLVLRGASGPSGRAAGREDPRDMGGGRGDPVAPASPDHAPVEPAGVEKDENRIQPAAGTERWHYQKFLQMAAADPDAFERLANEKTGRGVPLQERVALLRAAWKVRGKEALPWFAAAFAAGAGARDSDAVALRGFVVRHLASHARAVPEIRGFLWEAVFLDGAVDPRNRSAAGRAVLEAAEPAEIPTLAAAIRGIADADVADGALVGLGLNGDAAAATALDWLATDHPEQSVRERAAEVARQRLAGELPVDEED